MTLYVETMNAMAHCEGERLRAAIELTLEENSHLADGENCTLIRLKKALAGKEVEG